MDDLFEREQNILERALSYQEKARQDGVCRFEEYAAIVKEYRRLLKQLRRITRISDKTTIDLNISKLHLLDKVYSDELTGIYNRRFLEESLPQIIPPLSQPGSTLSVLMIDVDFFKRYNDTYGHSKGDECLHAVAQAIKECLVRPEDFVARYGGEEFIAVMPDMDGPETCLLAQRILDRVQGCRIPHEKNEASAYVTVSVGAVTGETVYSRNAEAYIAKADKALYMSKQNGRNRYTFIRFEEEA